MDNVGTDQRKIMGLMAFAVIFSLIGDEIDKAEGPDQTNAQAEGFFSSGAKIILGGMIATGILMFVAEFGSGGAQLSQGLAGTAAVAAMFVKGGPVWKGISNLMGGTASTPTAPVGGSGTIGAAATFANSSTPSTPSK